MDLYADPPGTRLEDATQFTAALGGSSANIAAGLCRQGCDAALVTRVSDDAVGRFCLAQLDAYGVDRRFVAVEGGEARNSLAIVETRATDTQAVLYRHRAADFEMVEADVTALSYHAYSALITTGTVLAAQPSRDACFAAFDQACAAGLPLVFDVDYRPYSWTSQEEAAEVYARAAALCDIVIGNDVEFGVMAGDHDAGLETARALVAGGARVVVYKMGEKGAVTITPEGEMRTGIYRSQAIKPTGAGDGFMAGFLAGLADGHDVAEAVARGSAAAALVVSRVGCAPAMPTAAEIDRFRATTEMTPPA